MEGALKSVSHGLQKILAMALSLRNHPQYSYARDPVTAATGTAKFTLQSAFIWLVKGKFLSSNQ